MDDMTIISKVKKRIKATKESITEAMLAGAVDNMEKYKYIIGQINALESVRQEINSLLNDKEENESTGTVIDLNRGTKN